jgi:hypothetical protein
MAGRRNAFPRRTLNTGIIAIGSLGRRSPMAKLVVRIAGASAATSLALVFLGLVPFLGAAPTAGAGYVPAPAGISVNRAHKGDRLPVAPRLDPSAWQNEFGSQERAGTQNEIPFACDPSFSPVVSPQLAHVYGRCLS